MVASRREWLGTLPAESVGAEIGVMEGRFSELAIQEANPKLLYLVDHWTSAIKGLTGDVRRHEQAVNLRTTLRRMLPYIATGQVRVVCAYSVAASNWIEDESLDWVYIDAHHSYRALTEDMCAWYPKVKVGGLVAGHDYYKASMKAAVADFMAEVGASDLQVTAEPYPEGRNAPPSFWWKKDRHGVADKPRGLARDAT